MRICAVMLSDDDIIDDGMEYNGDKMERREGDWESSEGDDHSCSEVDATDSFHWKVQDVVG